MKQQKLQERNNQLRSELTDVENINHLLRQENEMLRFKNDMLWRLALDLRDYIEDLEAEPINYKPYSK